jgi:hypothetical protein
LNIAGIRELDQLRDRVQVLGVGGFQALEFLLNRSHISQVHKLPKVAEWGGQILWLKLRIVDRGRCQGQLELKATSATGFTTHLQRSSQLIHEFAADGKAESASVTARGRGQLFE